MSRLLARPRRYFALCDCMHCLFRGMMLHRLLVAAAAAAVDVDAAVRKKIDLERARVRESRKERIN